MVKFRALLLCATKFRVAQDERDTTNFAYETHS
jgi:hypothetical protein